MITQSYTLRLTTPGFLGAADNEQAMWRMPPIKALLRQWWRVAVAPRFHRDFTRIRPLEAALFGSAADDEGASSRSHVRLRLDAADARPSWSEGSQDGVHPEQKDLMRYIAWGLVDRGPERSDRKALSPKRPEGERTLRIAFPAQHPRFQSYADYDPSADLALAFSLIHHFGSLGGRSRNGWGSLAVLPLDGTAPILTLEKILATVGALSLQEALAQSWATGIAWNGAPLIWDSSNTHDAWGKALRAIAHIKREVRGALPYTPPRLSPRHILGLPVKDSKVLRGNVRMPSPLRFKVLEHPKGGLQLRVYAMPHGAPDSPDFSPVRADFHTVAMATWRQVEQSLDHMARQGLLRRISMESV